MNPSAEVLGIDIDTKKITIACQVAPRRWGIKSVPCKGFTQAWRDLGPWLATKQVAAIEHPFLGVNVASYGKLMGVYGVVVDACTESGIEVVPAYPTAWKRAMLTVAGHFPKKRKEQKAQALWVAGVMLGADVETDDEADAVCICEWARTTRRLEALAK